MGQAGLRPPRRIHRVQFFPFPAPIYPVNSRYHHCTIFDDILKFCSNLGRLGFDVMTPETEGAFVRIYAVRNARKVDPALVLPFRGHGR